MAKLKSKSQKSQTQPEAQPLSLKEKLAQKRKIQEARTKITGLMVFSVFFAVAIGLPLALAVGIKIGLSVGLGIPCLVLSYNYPRQALWVFLIYMPFSGTITYWLGGGNALFQVAKDIFYVPALFGLMQECKKKRLPILVSKKLLPSLVILLIFALITLFVVNGMQQFLPECKTVAGDLIADSQGKLSKIPCREGMPFFQGLVGLKVLVGYIPLIFCAYYLIEDKKKLLFLGRLLVTLAIICCVLALAQYWMLKTGRCVGTRNMVAIDLFKPQLDAKCLVGGALLYSPAQGQIRLPGTFVSPWHWAWFLVANAAISFTIGFNDTSRFWRLTGLISMALVLINAVISGQRLALALVPVLILALLILTGQIANFKRFIPAGVLLGMILTVAVISNPAIVQERIDSLVGRWNTAPPYAFMQEQFAYAIYNQRGIMGRGLGTATNSTRTFGDISLIETYHPKLLYEMGPLGLLAFMIFVTHLTILSFKDYRSVRDNTLHSFGSSFWIFILIIGYFPYWYPLDTDPVAVYYWFFAGILFKLPVIDKQEQNKKSEL